MKKFIITFLIAGTSLFLSSAQSLSPDLVTTSGDYYTSATASLSWSLGEIVIETYAASSVILTQGFQQPDYNTTSIKEVKSFTDFSVSVFPNPVNDFLNIQIGAGADLVTLNLYDLYGKLITTRIVNSPDGQQAQFDVSGLSKGYYLLKVIKLSNDQQKTYQIIKY